MINCLPVVEMLFRVDTTGAASAVAAFAILQLQELCVI